MWYVCAHVNLCMCLTANVCFIWICTSIYCICLLLVKGHERNHSNFKLKTQSGPLLSMNLVMAQGKKRGGCVCVRD